MCGGLLWVLGQFSDKFYLQNGFAEWDIPRNPSVSIRTALRKGNSMPSQTVCKTVRQYNKEPILPEAMEKLTEIANDYCRVKNYVYARYGGIGSLSKLYPGYTVQNEMTRSGLRGELGMPSVYFNLAIFDALGDIKAQWTRTKSKLSRLIGQNENFLPEEKHYLRFLIKTANAFDAVLNQKAVNLPAEIMKKREELASAVDCEKLHRYLCRQVRKHEVRLHADAAAGFSVTERAYRYADHGIYISTKQNRKRVFVGLTDNNSYKNQLYIRLYPEEGRLEIRVPVNVTVRMHADYTRQVGVAFGMPCMLTTHEGNRYGERLGEYQNAYAEWLREQMSSYSRNRKDNPGRKKYLAQKQRLTEQLHNYINRELNLFLRKEKPQTVFIPKLPAMQAGKGDSRINHSVALWQRGYIRERLLLKCREQSVEATEVFAKGIGRTCSRCGEPGQRKEGFFHCERCGYRVEEKTNTAQNVLKRGSGA